MQNWCVFFVGRYGKCRAVVVTNEPDTFRNPFFGGAHLERTIVAATATISPILCTALFRNYNY